MNETKAIAATKAKLKLLEDRYAVSNAEGGDAHVNELSLRSLKRLINQLKEELSRAEIKARQGSR